MLHPSAKLSQFVPPPRGFIPPPLQTKVSRGGLPHRSLSTKVENLPDNFHYNPSQLTAERDQGQCGSCWAFAITSAIADRVLISTGKNIPLSVQHLLNCVPIFDGTKIEDTCDGGNDIGFAMAHLPEDGLIPERIRPYKMINGGKNANKCQQEQASESDYEVKLQDQDAYIITIPDGDIAENVRNMKAHIYHEGPIVGAMKDVYPDFYNYDGVSVYSPAAGQTSEGAHAIEILGWGKNEHGVEYWICRNSWGDQWPPNHLPGMGRGWFYIRLGQNVCGIETFAFASVPIVSGEDQESGQTDAYISNDDQSNFIQPRGDVSITISSRSRAIQIGLLIVVCILMVGFFRNKI